MKTKIDMAHDYAMALVLSPDFDDDMSLSAFVKHVWKYADKMQVEEDKRKVGGAPDAILNLSNSTELDDCDHIWKELIDHKVCKICNKQQGVILGCGQWQPDWSKAPDGYNRFVVGSDHGIGFFTDIEPELIDQEYFYVGHNAKVVENHNYQGDWKESLRERP